MTINAELMNFAPILEALKDCVCEALTAANVPVCQCAADPSPPAWAACDCTCSGAGVGQLHVWPSSDIYPSSSFPAVASPDPRSDLGCGPELLVAPVGIAIARCVSRHNGDAAALLAAWAADVTIIRQAIGCCLQEMRAERTIQRYSMGSTTPLAEQGDCVGSQLNVLVAVRNCICPPTPAS